MFALDAEMSNVDSPDTEVAGQRFARDVRNHPAVSDYVRMREKKNKKNDITVFLLFDIIATAVPVSTVLTGRIGGYESCHVRPM